MIGRTTINRFPLLAVVVRAAIMTTSATRSPSTSFAFIVPQSSSILFASPSFVSSAWCHSPHSATIRCHKLHNMMSTSSSSSAESTKKKPGVATPNELKNFVINAGSRLLVVDVRNPDVSVEPGDAKSLAVAGFPNKSTNFRNMAINIPWNRETVSMELPTGIDYDTPIITHCGGGGRGQKAKEYLIRNGYTNVLNGGGPKETECWAEYGLK